MADGMETFRVVAHVTISVHTDVQAESKEQAEALAVDVEVMRLCHGCASKSPAGQWVTSGELDSDPKIQPDETVVIDG